MMYSDVVMEKAAGIEPKSGKGIRKVLDESLEKVKQAKGYKIDTELTVEDLESTCRGVQARPLKMFSENHSLMIRMNSCGEE